MVDRKRADGRKYLLVFFLTAIIFFAGLATGSLTSDKKLRDVRDLQEGLRTDTLDIEVQYALAVEDPCTFINTTPISDQLYEVAIRLDYMEGLLGKNDPDVLELKKYYSLLEIRQWLFERKVVEECGAEKNLILYFYSNEPGECSQCEEQGFILSYLRKKYGRQLQIFSFDASIDSAAVTALKRTYGVSSVPSLIINDVLYEGFYGTAELESLLDATTFEDELATLDAQLRDMLIIDE